MEHKPCERCGSEINNRQDGYIKFDLRERHLCERCMSFLRNWISNCQPYEKSPNPGKRAG
jgi:hypothetical protein